MFYVYEHVRNDTNVVFYVGKGCRSRHKSKCHRNAHWHNIVNKAGYHSRILTEIIDEELAFLAELERIDQMRRLGITLVNQTTGGAGGTSGYRHTEESKRKISETRKERYKKESHPRFGKKGSDNPLFGTKQSTETCRKKSENCSMRRPEVAAKISGAKSLKAKSVRYNGIVFSTLKELGEYVGVSAQVIRSRLFRGQAEKYGYEVLGNTVELLSNK